MADDGFGRQLLPDLAAAYHWSGVAKWLCYLCFHATHMPEDLTCIGLRLYHLQTAGGTMDR